MVARRRSAAPRRRAARVYAPTIWAPRPERPRLRRRKTPPMAELNTRGWAGRRPARGAARRVRGRKAGPPPDRSCQAGRVDGRSRVVLLRDLVGAGPATRPVVPDDLPGRRPGYDVLGLPALDAPAGGRAPAGEPGPDERPERPERAARQSGVLDWALAAAAVLVIAWPLLDFDAFVRRAVRPTTRHRPGSGRHRAGAGGDPPYHRLDPARHLPCLPGLRLLRQPHPRRVPARPRRL